MFCGAGGAARGYADAGWEVIGVDHSKQAARNYPYEFHQADAMAIVANPDLIKWIMLTPSMLRLPVSLTR